MSKIAIISDSTAYLPDEMLTDYQIHTLPLVLTWDGKTYLDGIDLTPQNFYQLLKQRSSVPTTSQPPSLEFLQLYERLAEDVEGILVSVISSGISGTYGSAMAAKVEFDKVPVEVIDTQTAAGGHALVTLAAARAAMDGKSLEEVKRAARDVVDRLGTYFVVDTLEYLHKGGRIGGASRYFGTALQIKPILYMNDQGKIDALEKARTKTKALGRLIELVDEKAGGNPARICIMHSDAPEEAQRMQGRLEVELDCIEVFIVELSPVIGAHVGPGTIGVAVYAG